MWVRARQYTGRIVTVSNSTVFDEPIFNYTREFPYVWEEMRLPLSYKDDRKRAEQILLDVADRHTLKTREIGEEALKELERRYFIGTPDVKPQVFWRLTDNWLELTVRFIAETHGVRALKDAMSRDILSALDAAQIGIASSTYDIVGLPRIRVQLERSDASEFRNASPGALPQRRCFGPRGYISAACFAKPAHVLHRLHSGHIGDYIAFLTFGLATFGLICAYCFR